MKSKYCVYTYKERVYLRSAKSNEVYSGKFVEKIFNSLN